MAGDPIAEVALSRIAAVPEGSFPDERAWAAAAVLDLVRAQDGGRPADATEVRLLDDGARLFVRFDCRDRDVWATHRDHDAPLWQEEVVEVFLAPGPDVPARYLEIEVNPLGAVFDARVDNPDGRRDTMRVDAGWDPPGLAARVVRDGVLGWRAEIALAWAEACENAPPAIWRANFYRIERPRGGDAEFSCWSPTLTDPPDFHKPARFGRLARAAPAGPR